MFYLHFSVNQKLFKLYSVTISTIGPIKKKSKWYHKIMSHTIPCLGINVWLRAMVLSQSITLDSHGKILTKKTNVLNFTH